MKIPSTHNRPSVRLLAVAATLFSLAVAAQADVQTWWGLGATANWSDGSGNWTNTALAASVPANGDSLVFANATQPNSVNDLSGLSVGSLTFTAGNFDFTGNLLAISGGITNSVGDNIFDLPVVLGAAQTFEVDASSLTFNGAITNGGNALTVDGAGNVTWTMNATQGFKGAGNLIKNGTGTLTYNGGFSSSGVNYGFSGGTIVNGGDLNLNAASWAGFSVVGNFLTINPGATVTTTVPHIMSWIGFPLSIYGGTLSAGAELYATTITLSNAVVTDTAGKYIVGSGTFTNLAASLPTTFGTALESSRTIYVQAGTADPDFDFTGNNTGLATSGSIAFTKDGPGKMRISGAANHTGNTVINAGTLSLTGTLPNSPLITLATNTVFDISGTSFSLNTNQVLSGVGTVIGTLNDYNSGVIGAALSPGGNGVVGTLTMDGLNLSGNGLMLNFDLAGSTGVGGGTNDLLIVTNFNASAGVTNIVNISFLNGVPQTGVPYTLIKYGNGFSGDPSQFLAAQASRYVYTFTNDQAAGAIKVIVSGQPGNLVWKGDGVANTWDVGATTNWFNGAPNKDVFLAGDNVTFSDVGSNTPPINVAAAVLPTSVTVNSTKDYVFTGSGKISNGARLVKSNTGNLTILTPNDNSGGGSYNGSGVVTVGNGGTTAANIGTGPLTNNTKVTFFENTSVTYVGSMSGTGSMVSFMPGATLTLTGTNTFTGGLVALAGTTQIGNNTVGVSPGVTGNITNYSTLNIYRSDAFTNQNNITSAGNTLEYGNGDVNVRGAGGMTVDGSGSINLLPQGSLSIGQSGAGFMTVNTGAVINLGANYLFGNPNAAGNYGVVVQNGGTISVGNQVRLGHWASEVSTNIINGGTLNVPNNQLAVGWDGIGLMTLNGGTVNCRTLNVDDNGVTAAINGINSTFTMTGGQLNIGTGGIGGNTATNALVPTIVLSGGTIATLAPAGWSSAMYLRLTNGTPTLDTSNATVTLSGVLSGNGGLTKQGSGYLNLNGTNIYTGTSTVAAGTLQGSGTNSGPIVVQSGANLSAGAAFATGTFTVSNVTMNPGANLVIDASTTSSNSDLVNVRGALTLDAATPLVMNFLGGTPFTGNPYTVVSNLVARTGHLVLAPTGLTRYAATVDESNPNRIQVSFSGANAGLVWQGGVNTNWNVNTDANWLNAGVADKYFQSDVVVFNDTGVATSNVNLVTAMTPAAVTVDSTGNYTLSGSPITGVTALTKSGTGTLTLLNNGNSYSGITTVANGTLQVGNGGTTGSLPAAGTVNDYGSVVFKRSDTVNFNGVLNGPGTLVQAGSGTLLVTATQNHYGGTTIAPGSTVQLGNGALADVGSLGNSPVTNNGTVNFFRLSSIAVATPYTGAGNFNFLGTGNAGQSAYSLNATNTFTGPVTLSLARIQSGAGAASLGSPSSITVNPGSQVYAVATPASSVYNIPLTLYGTGWQDGLGALRIENGGTWAGNITLANNTRIGVNNATTNTITGVIGGSYELETYGGNAGAALVLSPSSANTYNALRVSIGTAGAKTIAGNNNAIPNNIPLTMNGGTLQLNGSSKTFSSFLNLNASSSIQNGSTTTPATITLTPNIGGTTKNGTFADGATQPLECDPEPDAGTVVAGLAHCQSELDRQSDQQRRHHFQRHTEYAVWQPGCVWTQHRW